MKIHEECATAHEQNKYRATSGVGGSKKNLNRFHLGFAWTFYMIMAVRLSNNSRASDVSFLIGISSTWNYFYCPTLERAGRAGGLVEKKNIYIYMLKFENRPPFSSIFCSKLSGLKF